MSTMKTDAFGWVVSWTFKQNAAWSYQQPTEQWPRFKTSMTPAICRWFAKFSLCTCRVLFTTRVDKSYLVYMTTFMLRYVEQITSYGKEFFGLRCGRNFTGHDKRITFGRQGTSSTRLFTCSAHAQWVIGLYLFLFMTEKAEWMRFI